MGRVLTEEASNPRDEYATSDDDEIEPKIWVISPGEPACDHPPDELRDLGLDGLNGYYQCERCEAGLIIQNELDLRVNR